MNNTQNNYFLIKRVVPFLKPFQREIFLIFLVVPIIALLQGVQPYILKKSIDQYTNATAANKGLLYPSILFFALALLFLIRIWQNYRVQLVGQKFVFSIRENLFNHLQSLSIDFFEKNQAGKLLTRLTNDIESLSETFSAGIVGGANDLFSLIGIAIFMFFLDWKLTLIQLTLIPILILVTNIFEKIYRAANLDSKRWIAQLNSLFQESLLGLTVIKLFNRRSFSEEKFADINVNYIKSNDRSIAADASFSAIIELVGIIGIVIVILGVIWLERDIGVGKLVAFVSYSQMLFGPIRSLSEKFSTFQAGFTSAERIDALLQVEPSLSTNSETTTADWLKSSDIKFEEVNFSYGSELVLSNISFDLAEGQSLGIVGRTGSGKSTLIKLLCRFYDPTAGNIYIGGQNLRSIEPVDLRKRVLMVPQKTFLFSGSLKDNLILDKTNISDAFIEEIAEQTGLINIIREFKGGFNAELREGGGDLSSGEKQLISLTRALIQEPQILILDEATASLDPYTEGLVTNAIKHILRSGRTVVFIAHRINLVTECNQILVLQNGKIKEVGNHAELIEQKGYYAHLHELSSFI